MASPTPAQTVLTSTLIITSANDGQTFSNYRISTTSGPCVAVDGASNVTLENMNIGPCGTNNSTANSNGVYIYGGSSGINVYDSYIHVQNLASGCCDSHEGILIAGANNTMIQGNVLAFNETNIEINDGTSSGVTVKGNFMLNPTGPSPRGQQVQTGVGTSNVTVENNRELSCELSVCAHSGDVKCLLCSASTLAGYSFLETADQEDANNIYGTTGTVNITGNWIEGGDSPSGQGILLESNSPASYTVANNILKDTGQGCIGPFGGSGTISGNKCQSMTDIDTSQNGIYLYSPGGAGTTGPWTLLNNYISVLEYSASPCNPATSSCGFNSYGTDGSVAISGSGNVYDDYYPAPAGGPGSGSAYATLNTIAVTNPPPLIPPLPKNCVATSPYSTQTSAPPCGLSSPLPSPTPTVATPTPIASPTPSQTVLTSTLSITSANDGYTFSNYRISTTSGPCVAVNGASNVTLENMNIGPCGTDNSTANSNGVYIYGGSSGINVYDSYIHVQNLASGCCDSHEGILIAGANNTTIQGNVLAYNETNIEINDGTSSGVTVKGNFMLNPTGPFPRGQQFQTGVGTSNVTVENNRELSCELSACAHSGDVKCLLCSASTLAGYSLLEAADQEDANNIYGTTGTVNITGNWIEGGDSPSGQGILLESNSPASYTVANNILKDTGQGCIGPFGGSGTISGNKCQSMTDIDSNQNGIYLYSPGGAGTTGPWTLLNNYISVLQYSASPCNPATSSCSFNSYGTNGSVAISGSGNVYDDYYPAPAGGPGSGSAYAALNAIALTNPPPLIPPLPKNCVATSPYSTQTSASPCN